METTKKPLEEMVDSTILITEEIGRMVIRLGEIEETDTDLYGQLREFSKDRAKLNALLEKLPQELVGSIVMALLDMQNALDKMNNLWDLSVAEKKEVGSRLVSASERIKKTKQKINEASNSVIT